MNKIRKLFIWVVCLIFFGVTPAYANDSCNHQPVSVSYTWSDDYKTCTALGLCKFCMFQMKETVTTTPMLRQEKDCDRPEVTNYIARFTNTAFVAQEKTVQTGEATGHSYGQASYTWSNDNKTCTATRSCSVCTDKDSETVAATPTVIQEKTCILSELTSCRASFTNTAFVAQEKTVQTGEATGHSYGQASYTWSNDNKTCTATRSCSVCTDKESETATATPTLVQEKTCVLPELTSYRANFTNTAFVAQEKTGQTGKATGHSLKKTEGVAATAAKEGNSTYWHCDDCNKYFSDEKTETEITKADTVLEKLAPVITEGDGATVTAGEKKALSFTSDAAYEDFICVELDGKTVDESNYTVKEGSTIVTLNEDFVASLSEGDHSLSIVSASGKATAKFTVNKKVTASKVTSTTKTQASKTAANPETKTVATAVTKTAPKTVTTAVTKTAPKTGDARQMPFYMSLFLASLSVVAGLGIKKKKAK